MASTIKNSTLFQPSPVPPQPAPTSFVFEVGPSAGGPWSPVVANMVHLNSTVECEVLSLDANGQPRFPGVDFTQGDCFNVTADVDTTATHIRAKAKATVLVDGNPVDVESVSNIRPLPETNPGALFFLFVLIALAVAGDKPEPPKFRT